MPDKKITKSLSNLDKVISKAKKYQLQIIKDYKKDPYGLVDHFAEMERWATRLFEIFPKANKNVVLLAIWLHDTGHYVGDPDIDHSIKSEKLAREFLTGRTDDKIIQKVSHAVRSHRCKDVLPETIEEKIVACIDSASHMTDDVYIDIARSGRFNFSLAKIERDFRDINLIPEIKKEIRPLYKAWVNLITKLKIIGIIEETETYTEKS